MEIYKHKKKDEYGIEEVYEYTTDNLIMDESCYIETIGNIYPIKVQEWTKFQKYVPYLINSKKHLKLKDSDNLLDTLIWLSAITKNGGKPIDFNNDNWVIYFGKAIKDFEDLFSMITRKRIRRFDLGNSFIFTDDIGECMINETNFEKLRQVVQKMNLLREPKVFEDKLYEKMYYKAMKANRKEGASLDDIILTVVQDMKYTFEYIYKLNIFQLYALYSRVNFAKSIEDISNNRAYMEKKIDVEFRDGVIGNLYKENDDSDLFADLDGIAGKLK